MSLEDAEDAVHEAMLRAVENPHIDEERLGAWLTTVTVRLCADRYRQMNREAQVGSRSTLATPAPAPVEEVVDRAEAKWLASRSGELPGRQAEALWLKSEDLDVSQVAREMGLSEDGPDAGPEAMLPDTVTIAGVAVLTVPAVPSVSSIVSDPSELSKLTDLHELSELSGSVRISDSPSSADVDPSASPDGILGELSDDLLTTDSLRIDTRP